jgi:hypothetical protein
MSAGKKRTKDDFEKMGISERKLYGDAVMERYSLWRGDERANGAFSKEQSSRAEAIFGDCGAKKEKIVWIR